jgi:hypothetical protein
LRQGSKNIASRYWSGREVKAANVMGNRQKIFTLELAHPSIGATVQRCPKIDSREVVIVKSISERIIHAKKWQ